MREAKTELCMSCGGLMTIAVMKSTDNSKEMINLYRGAWFGLRIDEDGVHSIVIACSEQCCKKVVEA